MGTDRARESPASAHDTAADEADLTRRREWRLYIFIVVFLFPILTVLFVSAYGFAVWMYQLIMGPPGSMG